MEVGHSKVVPLRTYITVPDSVISIGYGAFQGSQNLKTVTVGKNVLEISGQMIAYCDKIESITVLAVTPPELVESSLPGTSALPIIYVPEDSVDAYKAAKYWGTYNIQPIA